MSETLNRISFDEFSENLARIFDRIVREGESIVIEKGEGELVALTSVTRAKPHRYTKTEEDYEAFLASVGGWKNEDIDSFLEDNYESRRISADT